LHPVRRYYLTLLLNCELVSRATLCLVSVFTDIVKDCPMVRNLPKIFLRSFESVAQGCQPVVGQSVGVMMLYVSACVNHSSRRLASCLLSLVVSRSSTVSDYRPTSVDGRWPTGDTGLYPCHRPP